MLAYIQSLALLIAQRTAGRSVLTHTPPSQPFASTSRDLRGHNAGDLVDTMVEHRLVIEKVKTLETRVKYQIDKLVRVADQAANSTTAVADG
jgi:U3 small nucleolar ribonucleoprotein protein LCP5